MKPKTCSDCKHFYDPPGRHKITTMEGRCRAWDAIVMAYDKVCEKYKERCNATKRSD